jgi:hypothetical protein
VAPETPAPEEHIALVVPAGPLYDVIATHYGVAYNGRTLSCGTGYYTSDNLTILAIGPSRHYEWPCGTYLQVCGPLDCNLVVRHDSCPGCGRNLIDLSEAGLDYVCGYNTSTCRVTIQRVMLMDPEPPGREGGGDSEESSPEIERQAEEH